MKKKSSKFSRLFTGLTAALFAAGVAVPALMLGGTAAAATGQLTAPSITLSTSAPGATNVSYQVGFTPATSATIQGIVVDFCDLDPIIGDSCAIPAGFSVGTPTVTTSGGSNTGLTGTWTAGLLNGGRTLTLTNASGTALTSSTPVIFTLTTATNPSASDTPFYARILTYTTTAGATGYTDTVPGSYTDGVGVALSTASTVQITAKVMPTLTFCVSGAAPGPNCGGTSTPNIEIGHGTPKSINSSAIDVNSVYSQMSTNAINGAVIKAKISTGACGGLKDAAGDCIAPNSATLATMAAGTTGFGMMVFDGTGGSGTVSASANYFNGTDSTCAAGNEFALNKANMTGAFGDEVASSGAPVNNVNNQYCFAATASNVTPAGIYTADMNLIATGTF